MAACFEKSFGFTLALLGFATVVDKVGGDSHRMDANYTQKKARVSEQKLKGRGMTSVMLRHTNESTKVLTRFRTFDSGCVVPV